MTTTKIVKPSAPRAYGKAQSALRLPSLRAAGAAKIAAASGAAHRYRIGESVTLSAGFGYGPRRATGFQIVALLPSNGAQYQYRLRNAEESFERVAAENELALRVEPPAPDPLPLDGDKP